MLSRAPIRHSIRLPKPAGFTLVEMLVSVALVLVMMVMFAQVFVETTKNLSQQRGIAENDQRARMLSTAIREDLNLRTFRDVFPFRANEDTRQLGHSLVRRAGYFEYDEGNPNDDTDDVLQFTASINVRLQSNDTTPFIGKAGAFGAGLSMVPIGAIPTNSSIVIAGDFRPFIATGSNVYIVRGYQNNGKYTVGSTSFDGTNTTINLTAPASIASLNTAPTALGLVCLSESDPDFDDGVSGNQIGASALAEVCYFLRNGILYRRVLLIRDTASGADAQPTWSTGIPILWSGSTENYPPVGNTTFWRDFDYSAFYFNGKSTSSGTLAAGVHFHDSRESMNNSSQSPRLMTNESPLTASPPGPAISFPLSLGMPHLRFGHSTSSGLPQDASTTATLTTGGTVSIGRFNLQECSDSRFGYPGYLPNDPISSTPNTNPFDRQNIQVDPNTGLVVEYSNVAPFYRRGEDILMSNVLSFDVKVWDPVNGQFVDIGDPTIIGPFSPKLLSPNPPVVFDSVGNIVGGRLNSTYGADGHYRFDTWHPSAFTVGNTFYNEPPYYQNPPPAPPPAGPYFYNEPPFVPAAFNPTAYNAATGKFTGDNQAFPLSAIQITINYRDVSSNTVRQVTLVQSLIDRVKASTTTTEPPEE